MAIGFLFCGAATDELLRGHDLKRRRLYKGPMTRQWLFYTVLPHVKSCKNSFRNVCAPFSSSRRGPWFLMFDPRVCKGDQLRLWPAWISMMESMVLKYWSPSCLKAIMSIFLSQAALQLHKISWEYEYRIWSFWSDILIQSSYICVVVPIINLRGHDHVWWYYIPLLGWRLKSPCIEIRHGPEDIFTVDIFS